MFKQKIFRFLYINQIEKYIYCMWRMQGRIYTIIIGVALLWQNPLTIQYKDLNQTYFSRRQWWCNYCEKSRRKTWFGWLFPKPFWREATSIDCFVRIIVSFPFFTAHLWNTGVRRWDFAQLTIRYSPLTALFRSWEGRTG